MSPGSVRRAQLVSPFGVGAMSVLVNGVSVVTAGLDHWFDSSADGALDLSEYEEFDWRLQARLGVAQFRLPPDWRTIAPGDKSPTNVKLTVPVLRFPGWSFCPYCKRLQRSPLTMQELVRCPDPSHDQSSRRKPVMSQVPFVAICSAGHLDDFPFTEWVHQDADPSCDGVLRLVSRGGGSLEGQVIMCGYDSKRKRDPSLGCGKERSLRGIMGTQTGASGESTVLTETLTSDISTFGCTGARPWLGNFAESCQLSMRGALRAAGNVYFPKVESSIYLPRAEGAVSMELHDLISQPRATGVLNTLHQVVGSQTSGAQLRAALDPEVFQSFSDEDLLAAFLDRFGPDSQPAGDHAAVVDTGSLIEPEQWRFPEFEMIRETPNDALLMGSDPGVHPGLQPFFSRVRRVEVLRETRALRGFTRVQDGLLELDAGKAQLRRTTLAAEHDWLPAYVVKGEGIYFELNPERLRKWENSQLVVDRASLIEAHYGAARARRGLGSRQVSPRMVLLHTFSHLLMNQLIFECGYSSASLRERLYASTAADTPMAGFLIYTAAGDSEGTMGGLVRMADPDLLHDVVAESLAAARWCSTDPVCMDAGAKGQGPDSCNLAACHGCCLVPETSCEEFNRFLDRGLVVGTLSGQDIGYFSGEPDW